MRPRGPQNASKTIFGSKMMIFQKSNSRLHKINMFDGGRVSSGTQNRPQEAPRGNKKKTSKQKKKQEKKTKSGTPPLPPTPVKLDVCAVAPRSRCKSVEFYGGGRQRGVPDLVFVSLFFFDVVFYFPSEPLGVDFELPRLPSHFQEC